MCMSWEDSAPGSQPLGIEGATGRRPGFRNLTDREESRLFAAPGLLSSRSVRINLVERGLCQYLPDREGVRMIRTAKDFGEMVAQARKGRGITQRELALAINSGERFIVDLEAGKPTAQLGKALAAAQAAGVRLGDLSMLTRKGGTG